MVKRFLITTALEETWREDVPVLFLGEWCRLYEHKEKWQKMDAEVAPYHWDDRKKLYQDYLYLQNIYEDLLVELSGQLNVLHNVNHSVRYWRILVGPWLGYFIQMLFDRWIMLQRVVADYEITGVRIILDNGRGLIPNDMNDFSRLFVSDEWNELIFGELLSLMNIPIEWVEGRVNKYALPPQETNKASYKQRLGSVLRRVADGIFGAVSTNREYFFIASYLPIKQNILLQLRLGQIPKLWRSVFVPPVVAPNFETRKQQTNPASAINNFTSIARVMLHRHIPTAYSEGYQNLIALTHKLSWPQSPKAIFTANSYSSDDVFKAWAADKVERGTPLVIAQHGGNYGMALWGFTETHQIAIADKFLTWGWVETNQQKLIPVGSIKTFGKSQATDKNGGALLVETTIPKLSYHMYSIPVANQWLSYFEDQCRFVEALPQELRDHLLVRLYSQDYGWCQRQRWQGRHPLVRLDDGYVPISSLIRKSRLYISSYNATTYLESLVLNVPTIMFWNTEHWEVRDSAKPFFEKLKSVGIFHETPEGAARQMALIWDDIDSWWLSEETQAVRREFCRVYAHIPERPLVILAKTLRNIASDGSLGTAQN